MRTNLLTSLKAFIRDTPNNVLIFTSIGAVFLILSAGFLLVALQRDTMSNAPVTTNPNAPNSSQVTKDGGNNETKSTSDATLERSVENQSTKSSVQQSGKDNTDNKSTKHSNSDVNSTTGSSQATTQQQAKKPDYNLNENWYFATVNVAGLFNTCWPTELTEANEAQCGDPNSTYSQTWFTGIGVDKSGVIAETLASDNANQKAIAQHVDPRRGAGDEAMLLNENLCLRYSLSCGRW